MNRFKGYLAIALTYVGGPGIALLEVMSISRSFDRWGILGGLLAMSPPGWFLSPFFVGLWIPWLACFIAVVIGKGIIDSMKFN